MSEVTEDRYAAMAGPALAAELAERALPISGKVEELRARLREDDEKAAQDDADGPADLVEGEEITPDDVEETEPRQPVDYVTEPLVLSAEQAAQLTRGEARLRAFVKHVNPLTVRKYVEGDAVVAVTDEPNNVAVVLPFGIEVALVTEED